MITDGEYRRRYDLIANYHLDFYLREPKAVLRELRRVVKPGGVLVARVPDGDNTGVGADSGFGFPVHLQSWDANQLERFLGGTVLGFEVWENELVMGVSL